MTDPRITWHPIHNDIEVAKLGPHVVGRIDRDPASWMIELPGPNGSTPRFWKRAKTADEAREMVEEAVAEWLQEAGVVKGDGDE